MSWIKKNPVLVFVFQMVIVVGILLFFWDDITSHNTEIRRIEQLEERVELLEESALWKQK